MYYKWVHVILPGCHDIVMQLQNCRGGCGYSMIRPRKVLKMMYFDHVLTKKHIGEQWHSSVFYLADQNGIQKNCLGDIKSSITVTHQLFCFLNQEVNLNMLYVILASKNNFKHDNFSQYSLRDSVELFTFPRVIIKLLFRYSPFANSFTFFTCMFPHTFSSFRSGQY